MNTALTTTIGQPSATSIAFFFLFIAVTLAITWVAARKNRSTSQFYAAGRAVTAWQNGLALAGDYMSAASFLGIAGWLPCPATTASSIPSAFWSAGPSSCS